MAGVRFAPVILAGGSGTRFWPRSRRARAKQVLALDGERTMIQQTVERLRPLAAASDVWVVTNGLLEGVIAEQLPELSRAKILSEPVARNTAPACALAAFLLERSEPETVIGIFPSDQVVKDGARFAEVMRAGVEWAAGGERIVVVGVPPTRAETGYGYVELGGVVDSPTHHDSAVMNGAPGVVVRRVKRFTEKPDRARAEEFVASGNYAWNGGIFLWSARTLAGAIREHCPAMAPLLEKIAAAWGTADFERVFAEVYPLCENISVDYAVLEPRSAKGEGRSEIYCVPGDFGWNDLGSWAALHEHLTDGGMETVVEGAGSVAIDAARNYVYAPGKMVAMVGVSDLVVVETEDALLVTTRERSQDVGKVVAELKGMGKGSLI
ncbi:MAG: sugar phosphate nucleotidyltransferase [Acidobacteriaceae bacterium]